MNKLLICGAAAAALVAIPALGQAAAQQQTAPAAAKVHSRAEVHAKVAEHFARLDSNRDGFVTQAEAQAGRQALRQRVAERRDDRRDQRFDRIDSNKDGSISRAEFDSARDQRATRSDHRMARRGMSGHFGGRLFAMADSDGDKQVSLQEAQGAALKHFDMIDADRDGQVTREERRQMRRHKDSQRHPG